MKNERVSVIVPCFNSEKALGRLFGSLESQTYKNLEIILVDNNSNDSTPELLRSFAKKDQRVKLLFQPKKGASAARNMGIKSATGKYFLFIDSDDYLFDDAIENLINAADDADIVYSGMRRVYPEGRNRSVEIKEPFANREELLSGILFQDGRTAEYNPRCPVAKLYRTDYITKNNISFNESIETFEDALFNVYVLKDEHVRLGFMSKITYNYVINEKSLVHKKIKNPEKQDAIKLNVLKKELTGINNKKELIALLSLELFVDFIRKRSSIDIEQIQHEATEGVYSPYLKDVNINKLSFKKKILYLMVRFRMFELLNVVIRGKGAC